MEAQTMDDQQQTELSATRAVSTRLDRLDRDRAVQARAPQPGPRRRQAGVDDRRFRGPGIHDEEYPRPRGLDALESIRPPGNLQWDAVERIEPGEALIIDSRGDTSAGSGGLMLMTRLARRGGVAAITDGAFRDTPDLSRIGIPIYARGQCAATRLSKFHVADLNVPIGCGGVAVYPGDILVGDSELVVVVPRHIALEVSLAASNREELEA